MISPWIAFLVWVPISVYFFRRHPVRVAVLVNFIGGWAVLPSAKYTPTTAIFPFWIMGTCLPSNYFVTRSSVTALTGLLGILLVDRTCFRRFRPNYWDLPMAVWCVVPLLSAVANADAPILPGLGRAVYQALVWGVPYLAGRLYFNNTESLELAAKAFVLAGVGYVPICLVEIFTGPQLYAHLYGYEPYRWVGAQRYLGFRPIGFLEDGNQLGVWMATSALIAIWLWRHRLIQSILRIPIAWISAVLLIVTLLCQSAGSIVLLFGLLLFAFVRQSYIRHTVAALLVVAAIGGIGLRLANNFSLKSMVAHNAAAAASANFLKGAQRGSFGWRLSQDEQFVTIALDKSLVGSGEWDWWKGHTTRPWSLWLLAFGMYGIVGLLGLECVQLLPVARVLWAPFAGNPVEGLELRNALAAAILLSALDNLLNGSMILPLLLVIGGLSAPGASALVRSAKVTSKPQRSRAQPRQRRSWEQGNRSPANIR